MCGCSITAGLGNKMMDDLNTAREANMRIYKLGINAASHTHTQHLPLHFRDNAHLQSPAEVQRQALLKSSTAPKGY